MGKGGGFTPDFESTMSGAQLGLLRPWLSCALYGLTGELKCKMKLKDEEGPVRDAAVRLLPPLPPCCVLALPVAAPLLAFAAVFAAEMLIDFWRVVCRLCLWQLLCLFWQRLCLRWCCCCHFCRLCLWQLLKLALAAAVFAVVLFPLLQLFPVAPPLAQLATVGA